MKYVVYFAHGAERFTNEALYSILTFWCHHNASDYTIAIITDNTTPFEQRLGILPHVKYIPVSREQIVDWTGPQRYIHRAKPMAIQYAVSLLRANCPNGDDAFLFVDTDTAFTSSTAEIFQKISQGAFYFHIPEKTIGNGGAAPGRRQNEFSQRCLSKPFHLRGKTITIPVDVMISNSGAIGFNADKMSIFVDTCQLIDQLYANFPQATTEQTAISWALHISNSQPQFVGDSLYHYWFFKEYSADIVSFFEQYKHSSLDVLTARCHEIDPRVRYQPKQQFSRHHRIYRSLCKFLGVTWTPLQFPWNSTASAKQAIFPPGPVEKSS